MSQLEKVPQPAPEPMGAPPRTWHSTPPFTGDEAPGLAQHPGNRTEPPTPPTQHFPPSKGELKSLPLLPHF